MAKFWSARCNGGSTSPRSTSARRMSTIAPIGSIPAGQRSTHAMHVVHCQTPSGRLIHARTSSRSLERGSSSERAAATSAAGPTKPVSGAATGQADTQSAHSMQSSRRTNGMVVIGPRGGRHLAHTYERMLVGEAVIERAHVDDDIRERREVRQRLDADVIAVLGETADARKLLSPVDSHAAGAAGGMQA